MLIRPEKPQDCEAIRRVNQLAFGQEEEAMLVDALRRSDAFIPELSLVAEEEGVVVGHVLFTRVLIRNDTRALEALALAPMCIHPEMQRRGIGSALVEIGLEKCAELGHRIVIVVGHPQYYTRFGFRPAAESGIRAPFPVPTDAFMALALVPDALSFASGPVGLIATGKGAAPRLDRFESGRETPYPRISQLYWTPPTRPEAIRQETPVLSACSTTVRGLPLRT